MNPMKPMVPMKPMEKPDLSWCPPGLFNPSSSGGQGNLRYAFFPDQRRLVVERDGKVSQYETGEHRISGVSQAQGSDASKLSFTSQTGNVELDSLKNLS